MSFTHYKLIISALLIAGLSACSSSGENAVPTQNAAIQVEAYIVHEQAFNDLLVTTANLLPSESVELKTSIAGQVMRINFKEGQTIRQGQSLVSIDDRQWQAELIGLKAELDTKEKELSRKKALLSIEGSTQQEIDQSNASIATLKANIRKLEINIDLANIKAPFSGTLGMRNFSKGAYLGVGETITTLTKMDELKVDFSLPENFRTSIKVDESVSLIVNNDTLKAIIYAITPTLNASSRTFNVRAKMAQPATQIMPGTFAEVLIKTDQKDDALLVPTQAVVPEINDQTVYVLKNGIAVKTKVILGSRTATHIDILNGLNANDTIITTGLLQVKDGMPVEILTIQK